MQQLVSYWSTRYGVRCHWSEGTAHLAGRVMAVRVDARLVVGETEVTGDASDPGLLFRSAAMGYVSRKLRKYLHPTYQEG